MINRQLAGLSLAAALAATAIPAAPALADGAASTRNIILGGAAIGGTLLIINHNKKVHQKYAEYDRRQAQTQSSANNAEAAYQSERQAYSHEAALVSSYKHEVAIQHQEVQRLRQQLAMSQRTRAAAVATRSGTAPAAGPAIARTVNGTRVATTGTSYGWGSL